jgi:hypothetical protein
MRVLVCGGRDYCASDAWNWLETNAKHEISFATGLHSFSLEALVHGGARGADEGAAKWGESEHIKVIAFPANWKKHGKAAGPIRNQRMIDEGKPDVVIAFPGGRGTADMTARARNAGITVIEVEG